MKTHIITIASLVVIGTGITGCSSTSEHKKAATGAGIGTVAGAGLGAIVGGGKGAVIGGLTGAAIGGIVGDRQDKQAKELEKVAETKRTEEGITSKLKSDILFDSGKATVKSDSKDNLKEMADIMKKYPENVLTIYGYTDITGTSRFNEVLSKDRADAVKKQLVASGIPDNVIATHGLGPQNPVATNDTAEGRKQNRRVEIKIVADPNKVPKDAEKQKI
jgi:outer membrane protein OmpA-like peptidoglycan-associated protein